MESQDGSRYGIAKCIRDLDDEIIYGFSLVKQDLEMRKRVLRGHKPCLNVGEKGLSDPFSLERKKNKGFRRNPKGSRRTGMRQFMNRVETLTNK